MYVIVNQVNVSTPMNVAAMHPTAPHAPPPPLSTEHLNHIYNAFLFHNYLQVYMCTQFYEPLQTDTTATQDLYTPYFQTCPS